MLQGVSAGGFRGAAENRPRSAVQSLNSGGLQQDKYTRGVDLPGRARASWLLGEACRGESPGEESEEPSLHSN